MSEPDAAALPSTASMEGKFDTGLLVQDVLAVLIEAGVNAEVANRVAGPAIAAAIEAMADQIYRNRPRSPGTAETDTWVAWLGFIARVLRKPPKQEPAP